MKHIGLFEGIGGFSLAARWMGWETVAWCEWNEFGQKVLRHHFPEAQGYGDITKTDFKKYANTVDIVTGGFPCQPYSGAGLRKGKEDERHLWPEMLRAIREIQPRWVIGENVLGLLNWNRGMVFNEVQADLEAEGFEVWPYVLPACGINAPHTRERVWFIAYSGKELLNAIKPKDRSIKNIGTRPKEWGENWDKFKLGATVGNTGIGFYNGVDFEPSVIRVDDGISTELDELEAFGNAIVPQVAYQLYRVIELMEDEIRNVQPINERMCGKGQYDT